jgi:hypothetical protein
VNPGDPFVPADLYRQTGGKVYPPAILARQKGIPDNLKLLYWRLYLHFGENGSAWPGVKALAAEVGKSERQVQYDLHSLAGRGLIRIEARAIGPRKRGNRYLTLWQPMFDEAQPIACGEGQKGCDDQQPVAGGESHDQQSSVHDRQSNVEKGATTGNALPRNSSILNSPIENSPSKNSLSVERGKTKAPDPICKVCGDRGVIRGSHPAQRCSCALGSLIGDGALRVWYGKGSREQQARETDSGPGYRTMVEYEKELDALRKEEARRRGEGRGPDTEATT